MGNGISRSATRGNAVPVEYHVQRDCPNLLSCVFTGLLQPVVASLLNL